MFCRRLCALGLTLRGYRKPSRPLSLSNKILGVLGYITARGLVPGAANKVTGERCRCFHSCVVGNRSLANSLFVKVTEKRRSLPGTVLGVKRIHDGRGNGGFTISRASGMLAWVMPRSCQPTDSRYELDRFPRYSGLRAEPRTCLKVIYDLSRR